MQQQLHFDHEAFTRPITSEDRKQFGNRNVKLAWITASITFFGLFLLLGPLLFFLSGMEPYVLGIVFATAFGIALTLLIALLLPGNSEIRRRRFAHENGISYSLSAGGASLDGVLFGIGTGKATKHVFRLPGNVTVSDWEFEPRGSDNTVTWRYIELILPRQVPHLVLDAVANNGLFGTNLPQGIHASQRIELEGDFDKAFTVYAPEGYDIDLRYLLPPDTMALLADNLRYFDVEFFRDRLRIVAKGGWKHEDPQMWQFAAWVVNVLLPHMHKRTLKYRDGNTDSASAPQVASPEPAAPHTREEFFRQRWEQGVPLTAETLPPRGSGHVAPQGRKLRFSPWKTVLSVVGGILFIGFWIVIKFISE